MRRLPVASANDCTTAVSDFLPELLAEPVAVSCFERDRRRQRIAEADILQRNDAQPPPHVRLVYRVQLERVADR